MVGSEGHRCILDYVWQIYPGSGKLSLIQRVKHGHTQYHLINLDRSKISLTHRILVYFEADVQSSQQIFSLKCNQKSVISVIASLSPIGHRNNGCRCIAAANRHIASVRVYKFRITSKWYEKEFGMYHKTNWSLLILIFRVLKSCIYCIVYGCFRWCTEAKFQQEEMYAISHSMGLRTR